MADDDYHIYNVPRPSRSQSFPTTPPLAIRVRVPNQTVYTQNELYSAQLSPIPSSAPPALPPRRDSDLFFSPPHSTNTCTPPLDTAPSTTGFSSSKKRWRNPIPHFGSFREKTRKGEYGTQQLPKRQLSVDSATLSQPVQQPQPGDILTLGRLAESYPHSFPFQVKALQSYSFQASQPAITDSEIYNLLLVKQQKFVSMQDRLGMCYSIPLNSAVQFGYVNSSDHKTNPHTLTYKSYTKAADLLALGDHEMPRVMCAQETHKGTSKKCSVKENEVLLIVQVRKNKLSGRKYLKVYSFSTKSKKYLYPDCVGHFTTNPAHLRLWLTDMADVYSRVFPCQAIIYLEKRFTSALKSFPTTLLQADSYVTLTELNTQPSIIASRVVPYLSQATLLDLPMTGLLSNLQIELLAPHSSESLQSAARRAYEGLDITSLQSLDDGISERAYSTKCLFYTVLRRGSEHVGVNLIPPSSIRHPSLFEGPCDGMRTPLESEQDSDSDVERYEKISDWVEPESTSTASQSSSFFPRSHTFDTPSLGSQQYEFPSTSPSVSSGFHSYRHHTTTATNTLFHPTSPHATHPTSHHADGEYEMMALHSNPQPEQFRDQTENEDGLDVRELGRAVRLLEERVVPLEIKVVEYQQLQALVRTLSQRISKLERQLKPHSPSSITTNSQPVRAANVAYLRSLSPKKVSSLSICHALHSFITIEQFHANRVTIMCVSQVLELLEVMNLPHCKPTFQYMKLSGDQLSRYTDHQLECQLGVIPPADRERLMRLISGSVSPRELLVNHTSTGD